MLVTSEHPVGVNFEVNLSVVVLPTAGVPAAVKVVARFKKFPNAPFTPEKIDHSCSAVAGVTAPLIVTTGLFLHIL